MFVPDFSIFTLAIDAHTILKSYLRRVSFHYPGLRFSITTSQESVVFCAKQGMLDLFACISSPHQLLHEPIHIIAEDGPSKLESIFGYHSRTENVVLCFINRCRADSGTHEQGFHEALNQLTAKFKAWTAPAPSANGILGILSLRYPGVEWEGSTGTRVGNPGSPGLGFQLGDSGIDGVDTIASRRGRAAETPIRNWVSGNPFRAHGRPEKSMN